MAADATNLRVGAGGTVSWGTTGVTLPTVGTGLIAGLTDLGYLDEDGLTFTSTPEIQEFPVWQSRQPGRREALAQALSISGKFAEWNSSSVPRVFGGGSIASSGTYAFPTDTASLEEFATVADVVDSTSKFRFVFARVNQTEAVETQFNRSNLAVLPFNFGVLAPAAGGSPGTLYAGGTTELSA